MVRISGLFWSLARFALGWCKWVLIAHLNGARFWCVGSLWSNYDLDCLFIVHEIAISLVNHAVFVSWHHGCNV
jgi:hypothetical protein